MHQEAIESRKGSNSGLGEVMVGRFDDLQMSEAPPNRFVETKFEDQGQIDFSGKLILRQRRALSGQENNLLLDIKNPRFYIPAQIAP